MPTAKAPFLVADVMAHPADLLLRQRAGAPHLCVAAPAMFSPWVEEGFGPSPHTQVQSASQNTARGRHEAKRKRRKLYQRKRQEASKHFRAMSAEDLAEKCKARALDATGSRDKLIKRLVMDAVKSYVVDD